MNLLQPKINEDIVESIEVSSNIVLKGLIESEVSKIKENLTFKNPEYLNVKRYSKYSYTRVPEYITYYSVSGNSVVVPRGYKFNLLDTYKVVNKTIRVQVPYPEFCLELRETQKEAAEAYFKNNQTLDLNGIIQLPTGKGKSILGIYLAYATQQRTLVIVHKDDLVKGWKEDVDLCFGGKVDCGLIKAKSRVLGQQITIATVQTLSRMSLEEFNSLTNKFGMIILDEMHHCPSSSYSVVTKFPVRYLVGLTATPERTDGLEHIMNLYFGGFAYKYKNEGVEKDILPVRVIKKECPVYCDPVCLKLPSNSVEKYSVVSYDTPKGKKLTESEIRLSEIPYNNRPKISYLNLDTYVVLNEDYIELVLSDIVSEFNLGRSCVVFFTQKEHINVYFERLVNLIGVDNVTKFYGDNKTNDLSLKVAENKRKHVTLATYAKGNEGTNVKQWEVEFLVSSINNGKNVEQVAGRIRRTKEDKINPVLIYDYSFPNVYSLRNHYATRLQRYKQLGFIVPQEVSRGKLFNRGFKSNI